MGKNDKAFQLILVCIFIILCAIILFPFLLIVSVSLSNEKDIINYGYRIFPKNFDLSAYKYVFSNPETIINAYKVTIIYSVLSTILATLLMGLLAYPLTRKKLKGRSLISFYIYFTMLFSGGLVPSYILITQYLRLDDTIWVYILPGIISPWYVFMIRTFFQDIPEEIMESAMIDGANEYTIFYMIILPLSKSVLATVALFMFLLKWNDWMTSMLYINNEKLISLQYLLQRVLQNIKLLQDSTIESSYLLSASNIPTETVRMAMAIIVAGPALLIFPFFQKYFVKGLTVGAVKG